jgi:uncharacterized protein (TIGR02246 family)
VKHVSPVLLLAVCVVGAAGLRAEPPTAEAEIRGVLDSQVAAWNSGDVKAFMDGYWESSYTTFSGTNGTLRGWQAVLDRYRHQYPDRRAMGTLTFAHLEITLLAPDAALVLGDWTLTRANDHPGGVFTLVLRKFPQGWRIIHDHTSEVRIQKKEG